MIGRFDGYWAFLSNFYPSVMVWEDITYPTAEHAFNAGKTTSIAARQAIADARTPAQAKKIGRALALRPGWDSKVRYDVMRSVVRAKFTAHPGRAAALLKTGDHYLIEGNRWHDQHWGDCFCGRPACTDEGTNHLGLLLMELRHELR